MVTINPTSARLMHVMWCFLEILSSVFLQKGFWAAAPRQKRKNSPRKPRASQQKRSARSGQGNGGGPFDFWRFMRYLATLAIWSFVALCLIVGWFALDLPRVDFATEITRRPSITLTASDGSLLTSYGDQYGETLSVDDMSPWIAKAVLAIEDRRFYQHWGVDPIGLLRAIVANLQAGRTVQGGSTITQQTAKNVFLTQERTLKRKVQELLLAFWLEWTFSKDQILSLYLNRVYLGAGTYGMEAASRKYFGISARRVNSYQAAVLAGLLKAPSRYNPRHSRENAHKRAKVVLQAMVDAEMLHANQAATASRHGRNYLKTIPSYSTTGRYFSDFVLDQLGDLVGTINTDVTVKTTLHPGAQESAERALKTILNQYGKPRHVDQGAVVVMSPDGALRAIVGGLDYRESQYNRATQAQRQPGSAFKPFVYLAALESDDITLETLVDDAPLTIKDWSPENFDRTFRGPITVREAFARSINTAAVRLGLQTGLKRVAQTARRFGLTVSDIGAESPAMTLGTESNTLLSLTTAYAPFANGGFSVWPHTILEVTTHSGHTLYKRLESHRSRLMETEDVADMNDLLSASLSWGTGRSAALHTHPGGAKTGTSQDYRDALYIGYTANYITGVWVGNDDSRPMKGVTGSTLPAMTWKKVMKDLHRGLPPQKIPFSDKSNAGMLGAESRTNSDSADQIDRLQNIFGRR